MAVERINPDQLEHSPYYSQATVVPAGASLVFVGGQNAVDASGAVIGEGDIEAQTKQVMVNVMACLAAVGTQATDLVSLEIKVVAGVDLRAAAQSAADYLDPNSLPLVSVSVVQQLARPGALVEVSAVAARLDAGDAVWLGRGEVADPAWF